MQENQPENVSVHRTDPDPREGFFKAFAQVLVAAAVFGGLLWMYLQHVETQEQVRDLSLDAQELIARNGVQDLHAAEKKLLEAQALDDDHAFVVSALALANAELAVDYGMDAQVAEAEKYLASAEAQDAPLQERFGARGMVMAAKGQGAEAEKMLTDVVNRGGMGGAIFGALGEAQRVQGKLEQARSTLRRAAEMDWRNPRYPYWIAELYLDGADAGNAAGSVKKALEANPDHLLSLVLRTRIDLAQRRYLERAKETLEDVLSRPEQQLGPRLVGLAHVGQSELALVEGRKEDALKEAVAAAEAAPGLAEAHLAKGLALAALERDGAMAELQKSLELYPHSPRNYHLAAKALLAAGMADDAKVVMDAWGESLGEDATFHLAYGNLLMKTDDIEEAKARFEKATEFDPDLPEAWYRLGLIAQADKDYETATKMYNQAVQADDSYAPVFEAVGKLYLDQGHVEDGLTQLASAVKYYKAANADVEQRRALSAEVVTTLKRKGQWRYIKLWQNTVGNLDPALQN